MEKDPLPSSRNFLRTAFATTIAGSAPGPACRGSISGKTVPQAAGSTVVARVTLDRNLYDYGTVVNGAISFRVPPAGQTEIEWIDSLGRVAWRSAFPSASEY